jgi:hypothetical protein
LRNIISDNTGCEGIGVSISGGLPIIRFNLITRNRQTSCTGGAGGAGIGISGGSSARIYDNTISDNDATSADGGGIAVAAATPVIRGNLITGNFTTHDGGGIYMSYGAAPIIIDNIIVHNVAAEGGGISSLGTGLRIVNNTIAGNTALDRGSQLFAEGFNTGTQMWNNIFLGSSAQAAIYCWSAASPTPPGFRFNNAFNTSGPVYAGACANVTGQNGNVSTDPLFVDSNADYHLQPGSPAIDAGSNAAPSLPGGDFASDPRIIDGNGDGTATVDMGAYELGVQMSPVLAPAS